MTKLSIALALALIACGKKVDKVDKAIDELSALKDKMCACSNAACADTVNAEIEALQHRTKQSFTDDEVKQIPDEKNQQVSRLLEAQYQCWKTARAGHGGSAAGAVDFDQALAKIAAIRDRVCACKDSDCVDKIMDEATKANTDLPRDRSVAQAKQLAALNKQIAACMAATVK
jgi:hypothetical protein